jgi:hypothetical protein
LNFGIPKFLQNLGNIRHNRILWWLTLTVITLEAVSGDIGMETQAGQILKILCDINIMSSYIYICDGKAPVTGWPPPNPVKESDMSMVMSSWSVVERPSTDSVNLKRDLSLSTLFAAEGLDSLYTSETWS